MAPDLPRFYRAAFIYLPHVGTFRGGRGAWRVHLCAEMTEPHGLFVCDVPFKALHMDVPRPLRRNTFVNPTVLLRVLLEQRRQTAFLSVS